MIRFDLTRTPEHTHAVTDEAVRYYVAAPGMTACEIAREFLRGYAQPDELAGTPIEFEVARLNGPDDHDRDQYELLSAYHGLPDMLAECVGIFVGAWVYWHDPNAPDDSDYGQILQAHTDGTVTVAWAGSQTRTTERLSRLTVAADHDSARAGAYPALNDSIIKERGNETIR